MKGATVRDSWRVWVTGAGALGATIIAAACLATSASGSVQPPFGTPAAGLGADTAQVSAATLPVLSGPMVALGDSYTAGALLPTDLTASPLGCLRSDQGLPGAGRDRARRVPDRRGLRQRRDQGHDRRAADEPGRQRAAA